MKRLLFIPLFVVFVAACSSENVPCPAVVAAEVEPLAIMPGDACAFLEGAKTCTEVCGAEYDRCDLSEDDKKALGSCAPPPPGNVIVRCTRLAPAPC